MPSECFQRCKMNDTAGESSGHLPLSVLVAGHPSTSSFASPSIACSRRLLTEAIDSPVGLTGLGLAKLAMCQPASRAVQKLWLAITGPLFSFLSFPSSFFFFPFLFCFKLAIPLFFLPPSLCRVLLLRDTTTQPATMEAAQHKVRTPQEAGTFFYPQTHHHHHHH